MRHTVLVVDDDREIRETLVEVLEDEGVNAHPAANGREALDALRDGGVKPCLILLDLMMPVMDGRAFRELQLDTPELRDIPVVILSAYRDVEQMARGLKVETVLTKPVRLQDVRASVERYCFGGSPTPAAV
jgi:CheY-like chemotaxis protein